MLLLETARIEICIFAVSALFGVNCTSVPMTEENDRDWLPRMKTESVDYRPGAIRSQ